MRRTKKVSLEVLLKIAQKIIYCYQLSEHAVSFGWWGLGSHLKVDVVLHLVDKVDHLRGDHVTVMEDGSKLW